MTMERPKDIRRGGEVGERAMPGWEDSDEYYTELRYRYLKQMMSEYDISLGKDSKVLEIGSGNGLLLEKMKRDGFNVVGVDARPRAQKDTPQAAARAEQLPFADDTFDLVISSRVFDDTVYEQDQSAMMTDIRRTLKVDGKYIGLTEHIFEVPSGLKLVSKPENITTGVVYKKESNAD